ncbi:VOC family protein [Sphingomonas montanisoli]|uniref:VOC domain-containing protein n=1 Tax=Sphingomonas montanisoli TaxID=2606412 RepID=A0A5D9CEF7_9SPHN|nr:VOC family protein [Sphingomonas montanisoli]TZG29582.1 hypothetical protein FYJ91_05540 [Sphingomonas montanisoli]
MAKTPTLADMGGIMQIAFVPQDFDGAIQHWLNKGAGPFFILQDNQAEWTAAYGVEKDIVLDIALGNWGEMQIEIIRQKNPGKSIYSDWFDAGKDGVHHTCIVVDDMAAARALAAEKGYDVVHEGRHFGPEWIYVDTKGGDGTLLEILCMPGGNPGLAAMTREAARDWDGSDPIRILTLG